MVETMENLHRLRRSVRKGDVVTYLVQMVNEPRQTIALEVLHVSSILFPVEYDAELIVKLG